MTKYTRDEETYEAFLAYIREAGLEDGIREICLKHGVVLREIYLDFRGTTVMAARVEVWWWLSTTWQKSHLEIGRIFHREYTSITHAFARLRECAETINVPLDTDEAVHKASRSWAQRVHAGRSEAGKKRTKAKVCHPGVTDSTTPEDDK